VLFGLVLFEGGYRAADIINENKKRKKRKNRDCQREIMKIDRVNDAFDPPSKSPHLPSIYMQNKAFVWSIIIGIATREDYLA
jgi:hypothetical protein